MSGFSGTLRMWHRDCMPATIFKHAGEQLAKNCLDRGMSQIELVGIQSGKLVSIGNY